MPLVFSWPLMTFPYIAKKPPKVKTFWWLINNFMGFERMLTREEF